MYNAVSLGNTFTRGALEDMGACSLQSCIDIEGVDSSLAHKSQTRAVTLETFSFVCSSYLLFTKTYSMTGAYSNTGFDTNSCHSIEIH